MLLTALCGPFVWTMKKKERESGGTVRAETKCNELKRKEDQVKCLNGSCAALDERTAADEANMDQRDESTQHCKPGEWM